MKIHVIQTGTASVKRRQGEGVGHGRLRVVRTLLDREWTGPMPIYAFAIEHPEGVIVVDTGETARASEKGYFPWWHPYYRFGLRMWVEPEQEIGPQLVQLGIAPADVRWVVLTHLHTDHAGGLGHFPENDILVTRAELEVASGFMGRVRGYVNNRFPAWFAPRTIDFGGEPYGPFPASLPLTDAGDVVLVPVPGHTAGQLAVVVREDDHVLFFAGDSAYAQDLMLRGVVDGIAPDEEAARTTMERIRGFAADTPTVFLPAHDPDTPARLAARAPVPVSGRPTPTFRARP
jgi:N-acyl homoserine lactone hydrolase